MSTFKGFHSPLKGNTKTLQDIELVKQDLLNHFYTRKGERPMDQDYGFIGWDLIFELQRTSTRTVIENDVRRIIQLEPRVKEISINVEPVQYGFHVTVNLFFVVLETTDVLYMEFDSRSNEQEQ